MSKLVIGLGNPGKKYENNRHNVGHIFVDFVNKSSEFRVQSWEFIKTKVFMNESGTYVKKLTTNSQLLTTNLFIVHDDLDIPLGKFKIQFGVGPEVHGGINSIEETLGTAEFWRVRIGIDNRPLDSGPASQRGEQARMTGEKYVLEDFTMEEREVLNQVFPEIFKRLKDIV